MPPLLEFTETRGSSRPASSSVPHCEYAGFARAFQFCTIGRSINEGCAISRWQGGGDQGVRLPEPGGDLLIDPTADDPVEALRDYTGGEGVETAIDFSASASARTAALDAAAIYGRVAFTGVRGTSR